MARDAAKGERLTAERIVAAAREIARADGIDGVSMRRLAEELDVWPMSIYRYFRDKDELLDAIVGSAVAEVGSPDGRKPWREQIAQLARAARSALDRGDLGARLPQAALSPGVLKLSDTGIGILRDAGFGADEAARGWHLVLSFASTRPPAAPARAARSALAGLAEDDYPALAAAADEYAGALGDENAAFEYGLDTLLDGLERRLAAVAA